MSGTLFGIGLGPGDPELMTRKAARLIGSAPVVAYPAANGGDSLARSIAADCIDPAAIELAFDVPMTRERGPAQAAYDAAAAQISGHLEAGRDVALLCEGDPLFYGSFMYLLARLAPRFPVDVVPGVTSVAAASAALARPLVAREDRLAVVAGTMPDAALREALDAAETLAILKVGRNLARIRAVIDGQGLAGNAWFVSRASTPDQLAVPLAQAPDSAGYFSLILVAKGRDPWLN